MSTVRQIWSEAEGRWFEIRSEIGKATVRVRPANGPGSRSVPVLLSSLEAAIDYVRKGTKEKENMRTETEPRLEPGPQREDWIDFLLWLADNSDYTARDMVYVIEKPHKFTDEYRTYLRIGGLNRA